MSSHRSHHGHTTAVLATLLISMLAGLLHAGGPAAASPAGGAELLFVGDTLDGRDVFTSSIGGDRSYRLGGGGDKLEPTVSPDGRRIAFVSNRDGNQEIYVADRNGANPVRLTFTPYDESEPDWSSQNRIAYVAANPDTEIFAMNPDGTGQVQLTDNGHRDTSPSWSPAGDQLVYESTKTGRQNIWTMSASGANPVNILDSPFVDTQPDWSPDGAYFVFTSNRNPDGLHIFRMTQLGTQVTQVTSGEHDNHSATWAPDSDQIAFVSNEYGDDEVFTISALTRLNRDPVTDTATDESAPVWTSTCDAPFADTPAWVRDAVDWHWCRAIMTGYPDNTFRADLPITRAQVVRLLYRVEGSPAVGGLPDHGMTDVPAWVEDAVRWAKANNIMTGYPDGTFRPNQPITRGQTVRAVFRVEGQPGGSPHPFSDVPGWLTDAVNWAAHDPDGGGPAVPVMTGYPDNTFRDTLNITRAQTARLVYRTNTGIV